MQNSVGRGSSAAPSGLGTWVGMGALTGVLAGLVFALFQVIMSAVGLGTPLGELTEMVEGVTFGGGPASINAPGIAAPEIAIAGLTHLVLSAIYGAVFGAVASKVGALRNNRMALIGAATVFGLLNWIVNFFVISPAAFPWFAQTNGVAQFFAHTLFYGTVLGLMLEVTMIPVRRQQLR